MIEVNKEFDNVKEMDKFIKSYLKEYCPAGYDTSVKIEFHQTYEEWEKNKCRYFVNITRLESCD